MLNYLFKNRMSSKSTKKYDNGHFARFDTPVFGSAVKLLNPL